jgi:predicted membrane protein
MLFDGLYQPEAPLMWLAATAVNYAYMRAALIVVLVMLLVTTPPRSVHFRTFLAAFSSALFIGTIVLSYGYVIELLDAIVFIEVAIICMIEAVEANPVRVQKLGYNYTLAKKK